MDDPANRLVADELERRAWHPPLTRSWGTSAKWPTGVDNWATSAFSVPSGERTKRKEYHEEQSEISPPVARIELLANLPFQFKRSLCAVPPEIILLIGLHDYLSYGRKSHFNKTGRFPCRTNSKVAVGGEKGYPGASARERISSQRRHFIQRREEHRLVQTAIEARSQDHIPGSPKTVTTIAGHCPACGN
ncbi:hypothetical protein QTI66_33075 [Variovorax sp. J22R133]|uniref:hypothetical protein n=1 Tax=Variovorax brevis TaxID=3053503 RepID=UPI0025775A0B|nr:hypothetical protein [Variovorax sp. J22R133]MDM0116960.1 hypothetical protein [Variovorax sp. J22R133]